MLHGARAPIEAVRQWMKNPSRHLILWGNSGVGKTTILHTIGDQESMQAESHEDPLVAIENARHPTFFGNGRYAALEDTDWFTRSLWSKIEKRLSDAPPTVFIALSMQSIPYSIRKNCVVVEIRNPSPRHIADYLALSNSIESPAQLYGEEPPYGGSSPSFRQAKINCDFSIKPNTKSSKFVDTKNQPKAILQGRFDDDFSCHPLSVLQMAHHNDTDSNLVSEALMLHSESWRVDGLSKVSRALVARLRSNQTDNPPYRKQNYRKG
ncbi:MAG: hypothetical protein CMF52_02850 [Legionellales bacterium]|nr:hypothetical protein [Legionellales bacterium]